MAPHETKYTDDGKYAVLFGASPEPLLTEEVHKLEMQITLKENGSLFSGIKDAQAVLVKKGQELKTFAMPESAVWSKGEGWYESEVFIPTLNGEYNANVTFSFDGKKYSLQFSEYVNNRAAIQIPKE